MGSSPINLGFRFILEMIALGTAGYWGWHQGEGILGYIYGFAMALFAAVLWGTFAVPDDPSRSGKAPVPVPGIVRLFIELDIFAFGVIALYTLGEVIPSLIFGGLVLLHYALSFDRIMWLLKQRKPYRGEENE